MHGECLLGGNDVVSLVNVAIQRHDDIRFVAVEHIKHYGGIGVCDLQRDHRILFMKIHVMGVDQLLADGVRHHDVNMTAAILLTEAFFKIIREGADLIGV